MGTHRAFKVLVLLLYLVPAGSDMGNPSGSDPHAPGPFLVLQGGARGWFVAECAVVMMQKVSPSPVAAVRGKSEYIRVVRRRLCFGVPQQRRKNTAHATPSARPRASKRANKYMFLFGHTSGGDGIHENKIDTKVDTRSKFRPLL